MKINDTAKKILNVATKVIIWLLIAFTVGIMIFTIVSVTTVNRNDRNIFGVKFYIVKSDSMSKSENNADMKVHFKAGDIIFVTKAKDPYAMEEGQIISFMSSNSQSFGETVTHMIREVKKDGNGNVLGYVTFGTNTGVDDEAIVEPEYILGTYAGKIPSAGNFFAFVKTTQGYILCILIPILLLIVYNGVNCVRLFMRYKKEQNEMMAADRAALEAEKQQNAEMLRELQELKDKLAQQSGEATPTENDSDN